MKANNPNSNTELIKKAYNYANENHKEQKEYQENHTLFIH